jgi:Sec-independent protein translocase protein TatA
LLSPADLFVAFVAGLLLFGPEGLPQVARKAGKVVRELQSSSQAFVREMERAADLSEPQGASRAYEPAEIGDVEAEPIPPRPLAASISAEGEEPPGKLAD